MRSFNNKELNLYQEKFELLEKKLIPKTITEGNSEYITETNSITIEETNYGRTLYFNSDGLIVVVAFRYLFKDNID